MFNRKSSYALNKKDPNAIVYMDANEAIIRLTREDFASEEEFLKWKALSDADYAMHKPANDPIFTFIEKKRSEGKCGKFAMVAGLNKFLRVYYGKVTELYRSLSAIE